MSGGTLFFINAIISKYKNKTTFVSVKIDPHNYNKDNHSVFLYVN